MLPLWKMHKEGEEEVTKLFRRGKMNEKYDEHNPSI